MRPSSVFLLLPLFSLAMFIVAANNDGVHHRVESRSRHPAQNRRSGGHRGSRSGHHHHQRTSTTTTSTATQDWSDEGRPVDAEDPNGYATTRVIATLSNVDLTSNNQHTTQTRNESSETQAEGGSDHNDPANATVPVSNCTGCLFRDEMKRMRLDKIKKHILSKLRFKEPPNVTNVNIPRIPSIENLMMQSDSPYMGNSGYNEPDNYHATTLKVVKFSEPGRPEESDLVKFDFQSDIADSTVTNSRFYVYIQSNHTSKFEAKLRVFLIQPSKRKSTAPRRKLLSERTVDLRSRVQRWYSFDITKHTQHWINTPRKNMGLRVEALDHNGRSIALTLPKNDIEELYKPYLELSVDESTSSRSKREMTGLQCKEEEIEKNCCLYPLEVNFEEFKWDWIIAPKTYTANYCAGECPFVFMQKYPHTHLIQQANPFGSPGPCCTPTKLSPISMVYFDNKNRIIYGQLPGMRVDRCGCS